MDHFFIDKLGVSENIFAFVVLPTIIFLARVAEVSVNTIRIIYMLGGRRNIATILGFLEAFIWLVAIRQIFQHLDNWTAYLSYPGGFAAGILVGMLIEEKIAFGKVIVRIITRNELAPLIQFLTYEKFRYSIVQAEGALGKENLIFTVLPRERLDVLLNELKKTAPTAFYTIEGVKAAGENGIPMGAQDGFRLFTWLRGMIRN